MKLQKLLCLCLALVLALGGAALAESVIGGADGPTSILVSSQALNPGERYVLIARNDEDGARSYALVGAGDGTEAMELFGGASGSNEERLAAFERLAAALEPAITLDGGEEALAVSSTQQGGLAFSVGLQTLVELEADEGFAIVTGSFAESAPSVAEGCEVRIWAADGTRDYGASNTVGASVNVCPHCGREDDGSAKHHTLISEFCEEGHTQCMGDPEHYCDPEDGGCGQYYTCSHSNSHTRCIKCGKLWCYKEHGDHKELACGHRGCEVYGEEEKHAQCPACGGYLCDGKDHTLATCGMHHATEEGDHTAAACGTEGHYNCDGKDHTAAACGIEGHYNCDGKDHAAAACGTEGHYNCDGKDHSAAPCGKHYACAEGYDAAQHAQCPTCGDYLCDGKDHQHAATEEPAA